MSKDLQALFGLKWNPFLPELPSQALFISPRIEHFGFRLEGKVRLH
jgi:general secretion pathway protein A